MDFLRGLIIGAFAVIILVGIIVMVLGTEGRKK